MINFDSVTKKHTNGAHSLQDVTFSVDEGEFVFLIGPSGAGKTTALRMIIREELPTSGTIVISDHDITKMPRRYLPSLRQQIGVIFQDFKLLPTLTVAENIAFILEVMGKTDKEVKETVDYLLNIVGLTNQSHLYPSQLSGGEQQRVAIARAIANDPVIVLADEPTGNLDPENAFQVMELLKQINDWGTTILVSTHDKHFVDEYQSRVLALKNGKLIKDYVGGYLEELLDPNSKLAHNQTYNSPSNSLSLEATADDKVDDDEWEDLVETNIENLFFADEKEKVKDEAKQSKKASKSKSSKKSTSKKSKSKKKSK